MRGQSWEWDGFSRFDPLPSGCWAVEELPSGADSVGETCECLHVSSSLWQAKLRFQRDPGRE